MFTLKKYLLLSLVPLLFSCGGGDGDDEPVIEQHLTLTQQSIAEGSEVEANATTELTLTYDKMVAVAPSAKVTVNGASVVPVTSATKVSIPLSLEAGKRYQVAVAAGSFVGKTDNTITAPAFALSFSTKAAPVSVIATAPVNANATEQTKNVYSYLLSQYGKKVLSSSMANVNWNFDEAELVHKATGKYPAIATMDYIHLFTLTSHNPFSGWKVNYDDTKAAEEWWNNHGLIAASWHWNMPAKEGAEKEQSYTCTPGNGSNSTTTAKPSNIMKEGTWEKKIADEDLAIMAQLLKALQDKGIPVIFRPLHEASGNTYGQWAGGGAWFWWGIEGAEAYKKLWIYLFDYFKNAGVNNLIWVWTSQNNGDTDWYPGDEYVDVIGQDIYNQQATANASDFKKLQQTYPQKMVTLSECGNVGKISEQWKGGARWSYFMPWYQYNATTLDGHEHANTAWWKDAMSDTNVLSREDLPSLK